MTRSPSPRTLLHRVQDSQFEAVAEARTITRFHALALACDAAEQPLVVRSLELAGQCRCEVGPVLTPVLLRRDKLDRDQRFATEQAQKHVGLLMAFQRAANGLLDDLREMACRFLGQKEGAA